MKGSKTYLFCLIVLGRQKHFFKYIRQGIPTDNQALCHEGLYKWQARPCIASKNQEVINVFWKATMTYGHNEKHQYCCILNQLCNFHMDFMVSMLKHISLVQSESMIRAWMIMWRKGHNWHTWCTCAKAFLCKSACWSWINDSDRWSKNQMSEIIIFHFG